MKKFVILLLGIVFAVTACATASTGPDLKALHYSGGSLSAKKFQGCLDPSSRSGYDPGDKYVAFPTRQISYDATGGKAAEAKAFTVVSKDNAELYVPATVTFSLDTDCQVLQKFYETIGARYNAGFDPNGDSGNPPKGWGDLLNYVIGKPLDTTLDRVAQNYDYRAVWNDPAVKAQFEKEVNENIETLVNRQAGGDFFQDFTVLILKPDPKDPALKKAIADEQAAVAQANAAKAKADADTRTAQAQLALQQAQASAKQAEIKGYGGIDNYLRHEAIQAGQNPFQPSYPLVGTK
jgi:regulator of protease activity HflC (stomatin/prohibitin superfamily)